MQAAVSLPRFPSTRYQGSKRKIIGLLAGIFDNLQFDSAVDLYSGSGMVTLLLRYMGKTVSANDYLKFNRMAARMFLQALPSDFDEDEFVKNLDYLLNKGAVSRWVVTESYEGVFFLESENRQIDRFCQLIKWFEVSEIKKDILRYCVGQALLMKRPYNLFHRANLNMRTKDVERSFGNAKTWETTIEIHALKIFRELAKFPYPTGDLIKHHTFNANTTDLSGFPKNVDMVYLDPPYLNSKSVGLKYSDFYHFLDGLCDYEKFALRDTSVAHMPIVSDRSAWTTRAGATDEISRIVEYWKHSILAVSYRNDGVPTESEMLELLSVRGRKVDLHAEVSYKYALSHSGTTKEQVILSTP